MCGIAGIMMFGMNRTEAQLEYIRELAGELAIENQARGNHATGIATFNSQGNYKVLKHNVSAKQLTTYDTWINHLDKEINNETTNILIHTRYATQGSPTINDNNHPLVSATAVGVHNGMIYNDDSLFEKEGLFRLAQVDSEVIFRLADKEIGNDTEHIVNVAEKLSGVFAVAYVKKSEPSKLNYFRNDNPTTFAYIPELNIILFASIKMYIESAIDSANITCSYMGKFEVNSDTLTWFEPKRNIAMQFDVSENTPLQQLAQEQTDFNENDEGWYSYGSNVYAWQDDDFDYYDYRGQRTSGTMSKRSKVEEPQSVYEFLEEKGIEHLMSDDDYATLIGLLDTLEKNEWTKGYRDGRESLESDIRLLKEEAEEAKVKRLAN